MPAILKTRTVGFLGSAGYAGSIGYTGSYDGNANFSGYTGSTVPTVKTSPLENREIDWNFIALNNIKLDYNGSGANLTGLNAANVATGTLSPQRGGTGYTGSIYPGNVIMGTTGGNGTAANLTAGTNIAITNATGSISIATSATPSFTTVTTTGAGTIGGDLTVTGGDIITSSGTATVFNTGATILNIGQGADTISIGATSGTTTIRNNVAITGDLTVSGGDLITTAGFNLAQAATTLSIGATTGTATIRNATVAVTNALTVGTSLTVGTTLSVTGNTTLTGDLTVNGGDLITTTSFNFAQAATTLSIGATTGTTSIRNNLTLAAGTTTTAPLKFTTGVTLTTPVAGSMEYDGNQLYFTTTDTGRGKSLIPQVAHYFNTTTVTIPVTTVTDVFASGGSAFATVANRGYEFEFHILGQKGATAGALTYQITSSAATGQSVVVSSPNIYGAAAINTFRTTTAATTAMTASTSIAANALYYHVIKAFVYNGAGAASTIRLQVASAGGATGTLYGSYYTVKEIPLTSVGAFVA